MAFVYKGSCIIDMDMESLDEMTERQAAVAKLKIQQILTEIQLGSAGASSQRSHGFQPSVAETANASVHYLQPYWQGTGFDSNTNFAPYCVADNASSMHLGLGNDELGSGDVQQHS